MNSDFYHFPNIGYSISKLPPNVFAYLKKQIKLIEDDFDSATPSNKLLSGNIKKEFDLQNCDTAISKHLEEEIDNFDNAFKYLDSKGLPKNISAKIDSMWVNFQKKFEFNPNHIHNGDLSFVIFIRVPYNIKTEHANSPGVNANNNTSGCFSFVYTTSTGNLADIYLPVDGEWEGKMLLFPSTLMHCVYPFFSSEDYRITVAGNVTLLRP